VGPGIHKDRWNTYIRELKRLLKHGGWLQCAEYYYNVQSDSGRLTENQELYRWGQGYRAAMERDRDPRVGRTLGDKLRHAGFTDVNTRSFHIPIGDWPTGIVHPHPLSLCLLVESRRNRCNFIHTFGWLTVMQPDARQKAIGIRNRQNLEEMLESHAILPFTQRLGWTPEQVGWMVDGAKQEMQDPRLRLYLPL
jgi:hypothetical protein